METMQKLRSLAARFSKVDK